MVDDVLRRRLTPGRPYKTFVMRIPVDALAQLKALAAASGCHSFRMVIKMCMSHAVKRAEARSQNSDMKY